MMWVLDHLAMVVFGRHVEVWKCALWTVDIAAGTMARSGPSPSESLFAVDLERGSEGGDKPVEVMAQQRNFAHTRSQLHAL